MDALELKIHLLEPLLLTQPYTGEENSSISHDFIPGSAVRGAVIAAYKRHAANGELDLEKDAEAMRLFFGGGLVFLNGYLANELGKRALPCPFSWLAEKNRMDDDPLELYDFAIEPVVKHEALKNAPKPYFWWGDGPGSIRLCAPKRMELVHNASVERNQKQAGKSFVFRYEAIAPEEDFIAVILGEKADLEQTRKLLEDTPVLLGGARTGGYGLVEVRCNLRSDWQEYSPSSADGDFFTITLLSDAILRDADGMTGGNIGAILAQELGLQASDIRHMYTKTRLIGGFNRTAGLPLPQARALCAGSVFVFAGSPPSDLRAKLQKGMGERRVEGYGRAALDLTRQEKLSASKSGEIAHLAPGNKPQLPASAQKLAKRCAERMLEARLTSALPGAINRLKINNPPQNAQIARLRSVLQIARAEQKFDCVFNFMKALRKNALRQLERCTVSGTPLKIWLEKRMEKMDVIEQFSLVEDEFPTAAGEKAELNVSIRFNYTLRLIDGLLKKAAKENIKPTGQEVVE